MTEKKNGLMRRVPLLFLLAALVYSATSGYKHIRNAAAVLVEMYRRIKKPLKKDLNALKRLARNGEDKEGDEESPSDGCIKPKIKEAT